MLDRTKAPAFQRTNQFDLLKPEIERLKNGSSVYFLSGGQQEVIRIEIVFSAGRWYEENWGASHFTSNLISKGTSTKNSFTIASIFDLYGAHLEIAPGLDTVSVSLYSLTKNLHYVLPLLREVLSESTFPEKELAQSKVIFLQNLKVNREKTSFQASKLFRKSLFGESHPYGKEIEENDVDALTQDLLVNHFSRYFRDYFIIASGLIDDGSKKLINDIFSGLPHMQSAASARATEPAVPGRLFQEKEGSVQATVRVGKSCIGRTHPDYFDVLLLNHLLGGYFGSRLMKNIREEKGLTYGVYSSIHTLLHENYMVIGADVNKENLDLTFAEIRRELDRLCNQEIDRDELQTARNHFIGSLQAEITTPFSHADKLKNILLYGLPDAYYTNLIRRMDSVSANDLMETAQRHFSHEGFFEIAVG